MLAKNEAVKFLQDRYLLFETQKKTAETNN